MTATSGWFGLPDADAPGGIALWHLRVTTAGHTRADEIPLPTDHASSHAYIDRAADAEQMIAANPTLSRGLWVRKVGSCPYCGTRRLSTAVARRRGACAPCAATRDHDELDRLATALRAVDDHRATHTT